MFVGDLVARGLGFLFPVVLARAMDAKNFATVYFFIATGWFVSELVLTGFPTAATRALAKEPEHEHGSWLTSALIGGLPLLALSLGSGAVLALAAGENPLLIAFVVIGLTIDAYFFGLLRGLGRFRLLVAYRVSANLFQILLLVVLVVTGVTSVAWIVALYSFVYLIPIAVIESTSRPLTRTVRQQSRPTRARIMSLTRFAVPALIHGTAYAGIVLLDVFFVRVLAPDALADYAAARTLALPMTYFPYAVSVVLLPRAAAAPVAERWSLLRRALLVASAVSVIAALGYMLMGGLLLDVAFSKEYADASAIFDVLPGAFGLMGLCAILSQWSWALGRTLAPAASLTLGALVAAGCHALLTSAHGAIGASVSIAVGTGVALAVLGTATLHRHLREDEDGDAK